MTQGADDILSIILLALWGELHNKRGEVPLDIAPLLETVDEDHWERPLEIYSANKYIFPRLSEIQYNFHR